MLSDMCPKSQYELASRQAPAPVAPVEVAKPQEPIPAGADAGEIERLTIYISEHEKMWIAQNDECVKLREQNEKLGAKNKELLKQISPALVNEMTILKRQIKTLAEQAGVI
jgi:hypothetical protein